MTKRPDFGYQKCLVNLGFTLLELMVVLTLIGIVLAFALASYQSHIRSTHRAQARHTLMDLTQKLEQHYSLHHNYQLDISPFLPHSQHYSYRLQNGAETDQFTLSATPVGAQLADECGILLLNERLIRGAANVLDNRAPLTRKCWEGA